MFKIMDLVNMGTCVLAFTSDYFTLLEYFDKLKDS